MLGRSIRSLLPKYALIVSQRMSFPISGRTSITRAATVISTIRLSGAQNRQKFAFRTDQRNMRSF